MCFSTEFKGFTFYGHTGGLNGALAELGYLPGHGLGYCFAINTANSAGAAKISESIRRFLIQGLKPEPLPELFASNLSIDGYYTLLTPRFNIFYFLERLLKVVKLESRGNSITLKWPLNGKQDKFYPVSKTLLRKADSPKASLALVNIPDIGKAIQLGVSGTFKKTPASIIWLQCIITLLWFLSLMTSIGFALVWIPRYLLKKIPDNEPISLRLWPLLAALTLVCCLFVVLLSGRQGVLSFVANCATKNIWSLSLYWLTWIYALTCIISAWNVVARYHQPTPKLVYWHSSLCTSIHLIVTIYFIYWDVIGLKVWG